QSSCSYSSQLAALGQRALQGDADGGRHQLGQAVDVGQRNVEHTADVADRRPGCHGAEGDDLRDAVVAVLLLHVLEHALTASVVEVDVDVRHLHALEVEESLED